MGYMPYANPDEQRRYQREWRAANRAAFFAGKACARCGSTDRLELDHVDPGQKVDHKIWTWSERRRNEELAKCQVLCHDCHWSKTKDDQGWGRHGTHRRYVAGCRCPACRAEHARRARRYRRNVKARTT